MVYEDVVGLYIVQSIVGTVAVLAGFVTLYALLSPRKSLKYARLISDMYLVGIIKQLAEKDKVDLLKELKEFNRIVKKADLKEKGLCEVIENELKEKVADVQEKSINK